MNSRENRFLPGRRTRLVLLLGAAFAVLFSTACGKKGPLYLPDEAKKTSAPATTPPPQK